REGRGVSIDLEHIPLDDRRTFELLASGETTGVFQLESAGMRRYVRELQPSSIHDLAAMVALYRPGPMDNIPAYIRRKHGQEPVTYLHPLLEPYLEQTYGIFVYQEDIMSAAKALGGFSGPEADTLGYAIRKKKSAVLRAQKEKFVSRAAERGVEPQVIDAVFKAFEPFERYGFNKAHATCYGLVAYQTGYLKANYPVEYMASVLTAVRDSPERVAAAIAECRRLGITVAPPDVHASGLHFTVEGDAIRFGLLAVKNVGQGAIESIIAAREADGPFRSLADVCARVDLRLVNHRVLESLVKVGAFSRFGHPAQLLDALDDALAAGGIVQRDRQSGQTSLFELAGPAVPEPPLPVRTEAPPRERLRWEKELLGLYLSDHPLGEVSSQIGPFVTAYAGDLGEELDGQRVVVGGVITGWRTVITKARATMGVATIEDLQGSLEVIVFPKILEQTSAAWQPEQIVLVGGRVDHKGDGVVLLADGVWDWDDAQAMGAEAFGRAVAAGDRARRGNGNGRLASGNGRPPAAGSPRAAELNGRAPEERRIIPWVSPLREGGVRGSLEWALGRPARPLPEGEPETRLTPTAGTESPALLALAPDTDEPPLPDEAVRRIATAEAAPTDALDATPGQVLHVRFVASAPDLIVSAARTVRDLIHDHPGDTPVVLHVPAAGSARPMELQRGVAYDTELLSDARRRLGPLIRLELAGPAAIPAR
ncbi:MAG TPA: DNA polymerase III subunit alpha, partial [Candidatus Limnocylindrales bacterium]|nr:DNA polymerase III subunit alpha [Candidatus Limnocylindrales bacterium]